MAAIPRDLLESELFGHERGSFTGAQQQRRGRFEQADGGTLFLDEIGDMPSEMQTRLLRVLSEGHYYRVGGHQAIKSNVRVIAATHQNLEERSRQGLFREDLFHRLNVIRLRLPPLRDRVEDIPLLVRHFLAKSAADLGVEPKRITPGGGRSAGTGGLARQCPAVAERLQLAHGDGPGADHSRRRSAAGNSIGPSRGRPSHGLGGSAGKPTGRGAACRRRRLGPGEVDCRAGDAGRDAGGRVGAARCCVRAAGTRPAGRRSSPAGLGDSSRAFVEGRIGHRPRVGRRYASG